MRKMIATLSAALVALGVMAGTANAAVLYSSLPVKGTVSVASVGVEAYSFNEVGNEVVLNRSDVVKSVSVTMVDWACQSGDWTATTGPCVTTPGSTFAVPITLTLYRSSHVNHDGARVPGTVIKTVTRTFQIKYRPSSTPAQCSDDAGLYMGRDGVCHHGFDQNIRFPVNVKLPNVLVWGVSYNSDNSGPNPLHGTNAPTDSLNVGLAPKVLAGHNRAPRTIFWDTRVASNSGGAPFITGLFNQDTGWRHYIPAAKFITA